MSRHRDRRARLHVERLEDRQLLAGQVLLDSASGLVTINGTKTADEARAWADGGQVIVRLTSGTGARAATQQVAFSAAQVQRVLFQGFGGSDRFLNDLDVPCVAVGDSGNDYLEGGASDDELIGGKGNDTLVGFAGNDVLRGAAGNDQVFGMDGNDALRGDGGRNRLYGGAGHNDLAGTKKDTLDRWTDGPLAQVAGSRSQKLQDYLGQPDDSVSGLEAAVIELTNQERQRAGLAPLQVNTKLAQAARHHAGNMGRFSRMAHTLPQADLPDLDGRLDHYGYAYLVAGENIAWNFASASSVVAAWMNSPGHRANILSPSFTEIGVGLATNSLGEPYYCQVFGRSS